MMADILVNSLGLSVRATNALNKMQIHTLKQLLDTPIEEIKEGKNVGAKTVTEIDAFCKRYLEGGIEMASLINGQTVRKKKRELTQKMN